MPGLHVRVGKITKGGETPVLLLFSCPFLRENTDRGSGAGNQIPKLIRLACFLPPSSPLDPPRTPPLCRHFRCLPATKTSTASTTGKQSSATRPILLAVAAVVVIPTAVGAVIPTVPGASCCTTMTRIILGPLAWDRELPISLAVSRKMFLVLPPLLPPPPPPLMLLVQIARWTKVCKAQQLPPSTCARAGVLESRRSEGCCCALTACSAPWNGMDYHAHADVPTCTTLCDNRPE